MAAPPQRTCLACRRVETKSDLLRLVRGDDGRVHVDPLGSAPGRGAYVHPWPACIVAALERGRISRALRMAPNEEGDRRRGMGEKELGRLRNEMEEQVGER